MKRVIEFLKVFTVAAVLTMGALAVDAWAQGTPFGNGRGAFRGDVYVPSVFNLWFGDNTSSDVRLTKGANNTLALGPAGAHLGATAANKDFAGTCTLGTNCAITFTNTWVSAPACVATDTTGANAVKAVTSGGPPVTTLTITGTGTDVIAYACFGNPN